MIAISLALVVLTVDITHGAHSLGLSRREAREVWSQAAGQIEAELGVRLRVRRWRTVATRPLLAKHPLDAIGYLPAHSGGARINFSILPRYKYRGAYYTTGLAHRCGSVGLVRVGSLRRFRANHMEHARTAIVHELGHLLGAGHSPTGVMDAAALGALETSDWYLPFVEQSRREIGECQGR